MNISASKKASYNLRLQDQTNGATLLALENVLERDMHLYIERENVVTTQEAVA